MTRKLYAQGDILLEKVDHKVPENVEPINVHADGAVVLAEGEVTGHRHAFYENAMMFRDDGLARDMPSDLYLGHVVVQDGGAELKHEEHATIKLEPGVYRVRRQREATDRDYMLVAD